MATVLVGLTKNGVFYPFLSDIFGIANANFIVKGLIGVFSKWSGTFVEFSEFRESEESLKH